ncbi:MAG: ABC transporter ATP-binding protein/permease [Armatimonadetes bacterium]|nr:ABC transporter ATP-binding protein/permease [Armatimonadota bacterium]
MHGTWTLARRFLRPYTWPVVAGIVVMAATAGLNGLALKKLQPVFKAVFEALQRASPDQRAAQMHQLWHAAGALFIAFTAASVGLALSSYIASWAGQSVLRDIRAALYNRLQFVRIRFFEERPVGELISRVSNDTQMLQRTFSGELANLVVAPLTAAVFLGLMTSYSWRLSLLMFVVAPTVLGVTKLLGTGVRKHARRAQEAMARLAASIQETFLGIRVVRVFNLEDIMGQRFERENEAARRETLRVERLRALSRPLSGVLAALGIVATMVLGAHEIIAGRLDPAALMTFILMAVQAGNSLSKFTQEVLTLHHAEGAALRVLELLDEELETPDPPDAIELTQMAGELEFDHVSFAYEPGRPALEDFSLRVAPGEHVAIVGPSGAGKSTVASLAARLYDPDAGVVRIDGLDLRKIRRASYRRFLALVLQDTVLFSGSLRENIRCARPDATDEEVLAAAKAAHAHEFISSLPQGYDTELSALGSNLSGGQRQRIAIARALLRQPSLLILDEATSALDRESEAAVQENLARLMAGRTTIIIAHRLSTIRGAHRIVVVLDGRVVEEGSHDELMAAGGVYHRLYCAQAEVERATVSSSED